MSLPSQSRPRFIRRRAISHSRQRRRRRRRKPLLAAVGIVAALGIGGWWLWRAGLRQSGDSPPPALNLAAKTGRPAPMPQPEAPTPRPPKPVAAATKAESARAPINRPPTLPASVRSSGDSAARRQPPPARKPAPASPERKQQARNDLEVGLKLLQEDRLVEARQKLATALESEALDPAGRDRARHELTALSRRFVFTPEIVDGDPFVRLHIVESGERLAGIVRAHGLAVDWRFIMRINGIISDRHVRPGQRLKLVTGPFHAVVDKGDYRLDLYLGTGAERVFVASYPVGLGEFNSTPVGMFRVRAASKLINPAWSNPRTGDRFAANDPANPIGEHWIGLEGIDESTRIMQGYGIHGTIDADSIGRDASMGCIRMLPEDVALIYEVLMEEVSTVEIRR